MANPYKLIRSYQAGDQLSADDFNSVVMAIKLQQQQPSRLGVGDGAGQAVAQSTIPTQQWLGAFNKSGVIIPPFSVVAQWSGVSPAADDIPMINVTKAANLAGGSQFSTPFWMTADGEQIGSSSTTPTYIRPITGWDYCRLRVKQADSSSSDDATQLVPGRWCGPTDCAADGAAAAVGTISKSGFGLTVIGDAGDWTDSDSTVWHTRWCTAYPGIQNFWCQLKVKVADGHWQVQLVQDLNVGIALTGMSGVYVDAFCPVVGSNDYALDGSTYAECRENRKSYRWELFNFTQCPE
jgi:hypothetical protein